MRTAVNKKPKSGSRKPKSATPQRPARKARAVVPARNKRALMAVQPRKRPTAVEQFVAAVCDPSGTPQCPGGLCSQGVAMTSKQVRKSTMSASFGPETEMYIVFNDTRDPFLVYRDLAGSTLQFLHHQPPEDQASYSVPANSVSRVIAADICFEYVGPEVSRGGMLYHFPYDPDRVAQGTCVPTTWGAAVASPEMSTSRSPVLRRVEFCKPTEGQFRTMVNPSTVWSNSAAESGAWAGGLPAVVAPSNTTSSYDFGRVVLSGVPPGTTLNFIVTVTVHLEYYHSTHKAFSMPTINHPMGTAITDAVSNFMLTPGSNNTLKTPSLYSKVKKVVEGVTDAVSWGIGAFKTARAVASALMAV